MILHIVMVLLTFYSVRIGLRDAYNYNKSKTHQKKDHEKRPFWKKLLGIYNRSESNAPYHMKKYTAIRVGNIVSLVVGILLYVQEVSQIVEFIIEGLHFVCLIFPMIYDTFVLSSFQYGEDKTLHFEKSNKP